MTARPCTKSDVGSRSSTPRPPCPSTNPAATNTGVSDRKLRRASPDSSAPTISMPPKTAAGSSRKSTPAGEHGRHAEAHATLEGREEGSRNRRRARGRVSAAAAAAPPRAQTLSSGWEVRNQAAAPAPDQPAPPLEGQPEDVAGRRPAGARRTGVAGDDALEPRDDPERLRLAGGRLGVRGPGAPLPDQLHGPEDAARLPLADRVRERAARRHRVPERPPAGQERRPLHAVHVRGPRAAPRAHEPSSSSSSTAARTRACPRAGGTGAGSCARST